MDTQAMLLDTYEALRDHIGRLQRASGLHICSFDGHRQSGKTTIVTRLAKDLRAECISTDAYRTPEREGLPYVDQLALETLAAHIARHGEPDLLLVEGVCIGWTLERMRLRAATRVYCKRMTQSGLWADDLANYLMDGAPDPGLSAFDREIVAYHLDARPDVAATIVYAWNGDALAPNQRS